MMSVSTICGALVALIPVLLSMATAKLLSRASASLVSRLCWPSILRHLLGDLAQIVVAVDAPGRGLDVAAALTGLIEDHQQALDPLVERVIVLQPGQVNHLNASF